MNTGTNLLNPQVRHMQRPMKGKANRKQAHESEAFTAQLRREPSGSDEKEADMERRKLFLRFDHLSMLREEPKLADGTPVPRPAPT